jgi:hypothetical protein
VHVCCIPYRRNEAVRTYSRAFRRDWRADRHRRLRVPAYRGTVAGRRRIGTAQQEPTHALRSEQLPWRARRRLHAQSALLRMLYVISIWLRIVLQLDRAC